MTDEAHQPVLADALYAFEFVEFSAPDPALLEQDFLLLGFTPVARHRSKRVFLYQQGDIRFFLNEEPHSIAEDFARQHGPGACAMGFRVRDAKAVFERAVRLGAEPYEAPSGKDEFGVPALWGIGHSVIYLIDEVGRKEIYALDFEPTEARVKPSPVAGLTCIDHLTHNVERGHMDTWAEFYQRIFGFHETRRFEIRGKKTGLLSKVMASPGGGVKIPLNESADGKSQIEDFLHEFHGEGIQHIALGTEDIHGAVEALRHHGVEFLEVPGAYYEMVPERVPDHGEDLDRLERNGILIDGSVTRNEGLLLQLFTKNMFGPVFFELIQRKGNEGFGEGNFKALFEAVERDQMRRGVL